MSAVVLEIYLLSNGLRLGNESISLDSLSAIRLLKSHNVEIYFEKESINMDKILVNQVL